MCTLTQDAQGNLEHAMNLVLDMGDDQAPPTFVSENALVPVQRPPASAGAAHMPAADAPLPPYTADGEVEMQHAVAASLNDSRNAAEDDQLLQALADSMGSESGATAELVESIRSRTREPQAPVVLMSPAPLHSVTTSVVQALCAADSFCRALECAPRDPRTPTDDYWAGASPNHPLGVSDVGLVQRLQTLVLYTKSTDHGAVILGDVSRAYPRELMLLASRGETHALVDAYIDAFAAYYADDAQAVQARSEPEAARAAYQYACEHLFCSYAAPAVSGAPAPHGDAQPTNSITLRHTSSDSSVTSCLWSKLAGGAGADSLLITTPADVLVFPVQHMDDAPHFRIDEQIFLDPFLWDKRNGEPVDSDDRWRQVEIYDTTFGELLRQRQILTAPNGVPINPLFATSQTYLASSTERVEQHAELNAWLSHVSELISKRIKDIDYSLAETQAAAFECKHALQRDAATHAADPSMRTVAYDLCAALFSSSSAYWAYLRYGGSWWMVEDGIATKSTWDAVVNDDRGVAAGQGIYMLCYQRKSE